VVRQDAVVAVALAEVSASALGVSIFGDTRPEDVFAFCDSPDEDYFEMEKMVISALRAGSGNYGGLNAGLLLTDGFENNYQE
jgi:hypothetical protein